MTGLTIIGLKARISEQNYTLTEAEAVDLFFLYPELVEITWENSNVEKVKINGLNLEFSIKI